MSESLLKALMQLFALVANVNRDNISNKSMEVVVSYLHSFLPHDIAHYYLNLFENYIIQYHGDVKVEKSRSSLQGIKLLQLCKNINTQLLQSEKYVVLVQLMEYIRNGTDLTEKELDFAQTISQAFNIPEENFNRCTNFVLQHQALNNSDSYFLTVGQEKTLVNQNFISRESFSGQLLFLHIPEIDLYFFKYIGSDALLLNSQSVVPLRPYVFYKGSFISGSRFKTIYYSDVSAAFLKTVIPFNFSFYAKNVWYAFDHSDQGIKDFNLNETSGSMVGILGGSGVGKSTLLNLLTGKEKPHNGKILINGCDLFTQLKRSPGIIGYVPQDDLLMEELSVYQNLLFNARLFYGNSSIEEIEVLVDTVLKNFELTEIKDLKVGDPTNKFISGGERKRLNIAMELMREPLVLFVDEPTTGLSSNDSVIVMNLLKEQALQGKLVIVTIHQPSSDLYKTFDKLLVLDKGGVTIYYGNPMAAFPYFKKASMHVNPDEAQCATCGNVKPEQLLHIIDTKVVDEYGKQTNKRKISPAEWTQLYKNRAESFNAPDNITRLPEIKSRVPGLLSQVKLFMLRDIFSKFANRQYLLINLLEAPLLAVIISYFAKQYYFVSEGVIKYSFMNNENIPVFLFVSVIVALFMGLTESVEELFHNRRLHEREMYLNLSKTSYLLAKLVVLFSISAFQTLLYVLIANSILEIKGMLLSEWFLLFTVSCCANLIGLNVGRFIRNVEAAYIAIPIILIPQLLFSGFVVDFDKMYSSLTSKKYVPVIGDFIPSRWAFEALVVNQFKNNEYQKLFYDYDKQLSKYSYLFNFLIPDLQDRIAFCREHRNKPAYNYFVQKNVVILSNELTKLKNKYLFDEFLLDNTDFSDESAFFKPVVDNYLNRLKEYSVSRYNTIRTQKEQWVNLHVDAINFDQKKSQYYNQRLADMVLGNLQVSKIIDYEGELIQKSDAVYKLADSDFFRSHFFAGEKRFFNMVVDTYSFNMVVLWLYTLGLYLMLYINLPRLTSLISRRGKH